MGVSLKNIGKRIWDQVNINDGGKAAFNQNPNRNRIAQEKAIDDRNRTLQQNIIAQRRAGTISPTQARGQYLMNQQQSKSKDIFKPTNIFAAGGQKVVDFTMDKRVAPVALGVARSASGTGESLSGLYDLATPGLGNNRFGKVARRGGELSDQAVKDNNYNKWAYKGAQAATDVGTFLVPGAAVNKLGTIPKVATTADKVFKTTKAIPIVKNVGKLAEEGNKLAKVAKWSTKPTTVADVMVDAAQSSGLRTNRGQDNSFATAGLDLGLSYGLGGTINLGSKPVVALAKKGSKVVQKGSNAVVDTLRSKEIIRPSRMNDSQVAALSTFRQVSGTNGMTEEVYRKGVAAAQRGGVDINNSKAVDDLLGAHRTYDTHKSIKKTNKQYGGSGADPNLPTIKNIFGEEIPNPAYRPKPATPGASQNPVGSSPDNTPEGLFKQVEELAKIPKDKRTPEQQLAFAKALDAWSNVEDGKVFDPNPLRPGRTADVDPDVLEVQNAIRRAQEAGDTEGAKMLNDSLPPESRVLAPQVGKTDKPTVTLKERPANVDVNGEVIDIPQVTAKEPEIVYPLAYPRPVRDSEGILAKLGKIVETFYDNRKGNNKINYRDLDSLGKQVTLQINALYKAIGSDYPTVARKVQEAADRGVKSLDEVDITPNEATILRRAQAEMNYVRRKASLGNKDISTGDFGEMYIPRQKDGRYDGNNLFEGFRDKKPGSEFKRTGKMELDDIDSDAAVIGQYITRYGDTKLYQEERIARAMQANNPDAPEAAVAEATSDLVKLQDEVNNLESTIGLGGLGRRHNLSDGKVVETASRMSDIGRKVGKEQIVMGETPTGITNGDRINSVETHTGQTLGDYTGLNQYRIAKSFANSQTINARGDRAVLADAVRQRLDTEYTLPQESIDYIVDSVGRIKQDLPDELVQARVQSLYENAAVQQIMEQLQTLDIRNKTLQKDVSELANQILTKGTVERKVSAKVVSGILKTTNTIFRKLNVSSAINELSDIGGVLTTYGRKTAIKPDFSLINKYGLGEADPALTPYIKAIESGKSVKSVISSIDNVTNLYHFVEIYKAAALASTAQKFYKNLSGDALTNQIIKDYRDLILPVDAFTKTFLDNAPLYTQYMSWGLRNLQKEGRLLTGKIDAGILKDKGVGQRIARDVYVNLPTKTLFWLASNGLKGTAIMTAFGINDYLNVASGDYSGIKDDDKSLYDKTAAQVAGSSTSLGLLNTIIQSVEKEYMSKDENYEGVNPYQDNNLFKQVAGLGTPQFVKNAFGSPDIQDGKLVMSGGADDLLRDGYSKNAKGDIQYAAPDDLYNKGKAIVFGKGSTANARDYSGRTNLADRIKMGQSDTIPGRVVEAGKSVIDMAKEQLNMKDTNFQYPVSDDYKKQIQGGADVNATIAKSREKQKEYKSYSNTPQGKAWKELNNTKWNPETKKYETDVITPVKWRNVLADTSETNYNHLKNEAKRGERDFGNPLDPIYSDKWGKYRRQIMTMRSQDTGDDTEMKDIAYSTKPWYKEYMKDYIKYIKANLNREFDDNSTYGPSARVREYWDLTSKNPGIPENSEKAYPLINQYLTIKNGNEERGITGDPDAAKNFYKANADQLSADFDKQKREKWEWTNKMRAIEDADPIDWATFQNVTFGYEDDERKVAQELYWKFKDDGGGSKKKGVGSALKYAIDINAGGSIDSPKVTAKVKPKAGKKYTPSKPKVSLKKSKV